MRALLLAMGLALFMGMSGATFGQTDSGRIVHVGHFSSATEGAKLPEGWRPLTFKQVARQTQYTIVKEKGINVVRADSQQSASGLVRDVRIDLKEYPIVQWRWKAQNLIQKGDIHRKDGDDYAARLYIVFEYDPSKVDFIKKAKYQLGRLLYGDVPIAAINYIWDGKTPKETRVDNAYTGLVKMIVVESGPEKLGRWVEEERNVYQDYRQVFGEEPPRVSGVGVMTDTDNTKETAITYYGDIVFTKVSS